MKAMLWVGLGGFVREDPKTFRSLIGDGLLPLATKLGDGSRDRVVEAPVQENSVVLIAAFRSTASSVIAWQRRRVAETCPVSTAPLA